MKKLFLSLCCFAMMVLVVCSCSSGSDHKSVVPDDAEAVGVIDAKQMFKDFGIGLEDLNVGELESIGVDFQQPVYMFLTGEGNVGFALLLENAADFNALFDETREADNLTWGQSDGFIACHDGKKALVMGYDLSWADQKVQEQMKELMAKTKAGNAHLEKLGDIDGGIKARVSFGAFSADGKSANDYLQMALAQANVAAEEFKDIDINALNLNFSLKGRKNGMGLSVSYDTEDPALKAKLEEMAKDVKPVAYEASEYIPSDNMMWLYFSMNGKKVLEKLMAQKEMAEYVELINAFVNTEAVLGAIDGDVAMVLTEMSIQDFQFAMLAKVNDTKFVDEKLKTLLNQYKILSGEYKEHGLFYLTNSETLEKQMPENNFNAKKAIGEKDVTFYACVNMDRAMEIAKPLLVMQGVEKKVIETVDYMKEVSLCVTKDKVTYNIVFDENINKLVKKWTE